MHTHTTHTTYTCHSERTMYVCVRVRVAMTKKNSGGKRTQ